MDKEKYYPDWLYEEIIENLLPWESAANYSYEEFSEKYSLHDSVWIGIFADVVYENTITLAVIWDAVWLPDDIAESTAEVTKWPFLFIKIENVERILTRNYEDVGGLQRGISNADFSIMESGGKCLIINDHFGGEVEMIFGGEIKFLGIDREKKALPI